MQGYYLYHLHKASAYMQHIQFNIKKLHGALCEKHFNNKFIINLSYNISSFEFGPIN